MKVAIWANSPSPQQADFYAALRWRGIDLRVLYLEHLRAARRELGWIEPARLPRGENFLPSGEAPLASLADWRERVHVIPGYSRRVHRSLAVQLSRACVPWVHWSESSRPVWRAYVSWIIKRWYGALIGRSALGAFAQGDLATRDFQRWGIPPQKIAHLYYSVDGAAANVIADPVTQKFVAGRMAFVFAGSLCHRKGCDVLLRAFAQVAAENEQTVLVLVGDGPRAVAYRSLAARLGLADRVLLRGAVSPAAIGSVLTCCNVLALPSRFDGWGVVLNEGASAGLALIASDRVGAAYHVIEPGCNGFRTQVGRVDSLAAAMHAYVRDPALAALHGQNSRRRFQQFTPNENVTRFTAAIQGWLAAVPKWSHWQVAWSQPHAPAQFPTSPQSAAA